MKGTVTINDSSSANNFWTRVITGLVLVVIVINSVIYSLYNFMLLVLLINFFGLNEFYTLFKGSSPKKWLGIIFSIVLFISSTMIIGHLARPEILIINIPIVFLIFLMVLYDRSLIPFQELAITFLGIIYITVPCILLTQLAFLLPEVGAYNPELILGFFFMVWASDTGAYLTGKIIGRHPLFKRISPAKTWEGFIGGSICTMAVSLTDARMYQEISSTHWYVMGVIIIVVGTYGDLIKSRMKRSLNVKDSGNLIPGHGGVLDRFDSTLSSATIILFYLICNRELGLL